MGLPGWLRVLEYFYPRSPCGERHLRVLDGSKSSIISIHALLAESDPGKVRVVEPGLAFLSTLSLRRATYLVRGQRPNWGISIHALLAESDPRTYLQCPKGYRFLSTLSLRRATWLELFLYYQDNNFYPRSPCGERRESRQPCARPTKDFYPRSPCGERLDYYAL